jgi:hypothetical protein
LACWRVGLPFARDRICVPDPLVFGKGPGLEPASSVRAMSTRRRQRDCFSIREFFSSARRRSLLLIAVRPPISTIRCFLLYPRVEPALPFPMAAPVPPQISKFPPRLPRPHRLSASLDYSLPTTLCALFCTRFLCFQSLAASFPKTPGWGGIPTHTNPPDSRLSDSRMFRPSDHQAYRMSLLLVPSYFADLNRFCIPSPIVPVPPPSYTAPSLQEAPP